MTEPVETYDDGGALYEAGPFEVAAQPPGVNPGVVTIDGRSVTPHTARLLARVLEVAADRAEGQRPTPERPAEPDREERLRHYVGTIARRVGVDAARDRLFSTAGIENVGEAVLRTLAERLSAPNQAAALVANLEHLDKMFPGHVRELIGPDLCDRLLAALAERPTEADGEALADSYEGDPRLNMLVAWGAIAPEKRADPALLLARMDARARAPR